MASGCHQQSRGRVVVDESQVYHFAISHDEGESSPAETSRISRKSNGGRRNDSWKSSPSSTVRLTSVEIERRIQKEALRQNCLLADEIEVVHVVSNDQLLHRCLGRVGSFMGPLEGHEAPL